MIASLILLIVIAVWILVRNNQTYILRTEINEKCYEWSIRHLEEDNAYEWLMPKLASYPKMLFSWKPLKIEYWISEDDLDKLNS